MDIKYVTLLGQRKKEVMSKKVRTGKIITE